MIDAASAARGEGLKILARNRLEDSLHASPALAGEELFLRGRKFLYSIAATD